MDERQLQVTEDQVLAALAEVRDPDHGENIVALGWLHVHGVGQPPRKDLAAPPVAVSGEIHLSRRWGFRSILG